MYQSHQIFLCKSQDGEVLQRWGTETFSQEPCRFHNPFGLTVNSKYVYICDSSNHRVQVLTKNGMFKRQWGVEGSGIGSFYEPNCIFNNEGEGIFYVGDEFSVQLFEGRKGLCIQRIGDRMKGNGMHQFNLIYGICIVNDQLFVSDDWNNRIQIFRRAV